MKYRVSKYILAHDLGTSGNKAALFTLYGDLLNSNMNGYSSMRDIFPKLSMIRIEEKKLAKRSCNDCEN